MTRDTARPGNPQPLVSAYTRQAIVYLSPRARYKVQYSSEMPSLPSPTPVAFRGVSASWRMTLTRESSHMKAAQILTSLPLFSKRCARRSATSGDTPAVEYHNIKRCTSRCIQPLLPTSSHFLIVNKLLPLSLSLSLSLSRVSLFDRLHSAVN